MELGKGFFIVNVYGPYEESTPLLEDMLEYKICKYDNIILRGYLNLTNSIDRFRGHLLGRTHC